MERHLILRQARNRAGVLQKELADRVGCSQQTVVDIESGRIRKSKYLADICAELGLDYRRLMDEGASSQADLVAFDFGAPVPVIEQGQVADWLAGKLPAPEGADRQPCPVKHGPRTFAILASGNAMTPEIQHGDFVHVDPGQGWRSGDVVCLFLGSAKAPLFRRLFAEGGDIYAVASADERRVDVRLVDSLWEVESSALSLVPGGDLAYVAGRAIFSGRLYG